MNYGKHFLCAIGLGLVWVSGAWAQVDWIPPFCTVETWCLKRSTDCFVGGVSHPHGLFQAEAQYSVVRVATVQCGRQSERRTVMGPVEPVVFTSEEESREETARESALELCRRYRADYVDAAPGCLE